MKTKAGDAYSVYLIIYSTGRDNRVNYKSVIYKKEFDIDRFQRMLLHFFSSIFTTVKLLTVDLCENVCSTSKFTMSL